MNQKAEIGGEIAKFAIDNINEEATAQKLAELALPWRIEGNALTTWWAQHTPEEQKDLLIEGNWEKFKKLVLPGATLSSIPADARRSILSALIQIGALHADEELIELAVNTGEWDEAFASNAFTVLTVFAPEIAPFTLPIELLLAAKGKARSVAARSRALVEDEIERALDV